MADLTIRHFPDAKSFLERTESWLLRKEVENNLLLGVAAFLAVQTERVGSEPYLATAEDGQYILAAAMLTPPLTRLFLAQATSDDAVARLAEDLSESGREMHSVLGGSPALETFAAAWEHLTDLPARHGLRQGLYELREVVHPTYSPGQLRLARPEELDLLVDWRTQVLAEVHLPEPPEFARRGTERLINQGKLFIWDDGGPVSSAAVTRETPHGACIGFVYTPAEQRRKGFASSIVAGLSQRLLDEGRQFCCLYTDLANPTSNAIYLRVGYRQLGTWEERIFGIDQDETT